MEKVYRPDGTSYAIISAADVPPARVAPGWCGVAALHWMSVAANAPVPQEEIAKQIKFDENVGTGGDQFLEGMQFIGLISSGWIQLTLYQCEQLLDTKSCQIAVLWVYGNVPDDEHYSNLGAVTHDLVHHHDTQVQGGILSLRRQDFEASWYNFPDDPSGPITDKDRHWAIVATKTLEELRAIQHLWSPTPNTPN